MKEIIGGLIIASPFIALFVWMWKESGLAVAVKVYLLTIILGAYLALGIYLLGK
jgi:hypothetical protein